MTGMDVEIREQLLDEVKAFSKWAKENHPECDEEPDNGEWEIGVDKAPRERRGGLARKIAK